MGTRTQLELHNQPFPGPEPEQTEDALSVQFTPLSGGLPFQAWLGPAAISLPNAPQLCFQETQAQQPTPVFKN